jgi:hypothetical protein
MSALFGVIGKRGAFFLECIATRFVMKQFAF